MAPKKKKPGIISKAADVVRKKLGMTPRPGSKAAKDRAKIDATIRKQQKKLKPIRKAARKREARRKSGGKGGVGRRSG
jgi:hypothetical protein